MRVIWKVLVSISLVASLLSLGAASVGAQNDVLGGLELNNYCRAVSDNNWFAARTKESPGPSAAVDNWVCVEISGRQGDFIDMNAACEFQFQTEDVIAVAGSIDDASTWRCQRTVSTNRTVARVCNNLEVTVDLALGQSATNGDDVIRGTNGNDIINGLGGNDTICALQGSDTVNGGTGSDSIFAGGGNDTVTGGGEDDLILGGSGDDKLTGGPGSDLLQGGAGEDVIAGGSGDDKIRGGAADDELQGHLGNDQIFGGAGNDVIRGGGGNDVLKGDNGNDRLIGGAGEDDLAGGTGDDFIRGGAANDALRGQLGNDQIIGENGNDLLLGGGGNDTMTGGNDNDLLVGGVGDDVARGGAADDELRGQAGNDLLQGGNGNDKLIGGAGNDTMNGGGGTDDCTPVDPNGLVETTLSCEIGGPPPPPVCSDRWAADRWERLEVTSEPTCAGEFTMIRVQHKGNFSLSWELYEGNDFLAGANGPENACFYWSEVEGIGGRGSPTVDTLLEFGVPAANAISLTDGVTRENCVRATAPTQDAAGAVRFVSDVLNDRPIEQYRATQRYSELVFETFPVSEAQQNELTAEIAAVKALAESMRNTEPGQSLGAWDTAIYSNPLLDDFGDPVRCSVLSFAVSICRVSIFGTTERLYVDVWFEDAEGVIGVVIVE